MFSALRASLRTVVNGFWFVPGLIALGFAALALALVRLDRSLADDDLRFAFDGDASAARGVLATVAGSLITVAGLVFSLTVVVLVLVSGQFTSRSVPAFLADRVNQTTAGVFVGVFVYCLLVLRTVRDDDSDGLQGFVPQISVSIAVAFAVLAIAILLFFIHHLGSSIQAASIVRRIGLQTLGGVERLPDGQVETFSAPPYEPGLVRPKIAGYVRHFALQDIADQLSECDLVRLRACVGEFVTEDDVLAEIWPASEAEAAAGPILRGTVIGQERDLHEDVLYGVRQLAEIAMRGLSPGVNDPSTAESAIAYLRAVLESLIRRQLPPTVRLQNVVAPMHVFDDYVRGAFEQVGRYASVDPNVIATLLDAFASIGAVARRAGSHDRLVSLHELAEAIALHALLDARTERDRELIGSALARVPT